MKYEYIGPSAEYIFQWDSVSRVSTEIVMGIPLLFAVLMSATTVFIGMSIASFQRDVEMASWTPRLLESYDQMI
jgi:hypothetical protein